MVYIVEGQREEKAKKVTAEWGAEYMIQFLAMLAIFHLYELMNRMN